MTICPHCHSVMPAHANDCEHCAQQFGEQVSEVFQSPIEPSVNGEQDTADFPAFYPEEFIMRPDQIPSDKKLIVDAETLPLQSVTPPLSPPVLSIPLQNDAESAQFTTPEMRAARKDFPWIEESLPPLPNGVSISSDALQSPAAHGGQSSLVPSPVHIAQQTLEMPPRESAWLAIHQQPTGIHGRHQQATPIHVAHHQSKIIHPAHQRSGTAQQRNRASYRAAMLVTAIVVIIAVILGSVWFFTRSASPTTTALAIPTLTIDGSAIPGQTIALNGSHFLGGSIIIVELDGQPIVSSDQRIPLVDTQHSLTMELFQPIQPHIDAAGTPITVASNGTFSLVVTIPANWNVGSSHTLSVTNQQGKDLASQRFTVQATGQTTTATSGPTTVPPTPTTAPTATSPTTTAGPRASTSPTTRPRCC